MDISPVTTPPAASSRANAGSSRAISSDFETFLRMLTAQMTNQDPLDPMNSADFAVQLATFSGVEQQVQTNELLKTLSLQLSISGMAEMASWVGKEARAAVPARFDGTPVTVMPNPAAEADRVELVVSDSQGAEVQRLTLLVSAEPVEWAGVDAEGRPFPPGAYQFETVSYAAGRVILREPTDVYAPVREVRAEGSEIMLALEGGGTIPAVLVSALRDPPR